jgi:hypothetical protein
VRVQAEDRLEDELVLRDVEVGAANDLDDVRYGVLAEEHSADGALLGEKIMRRDAIAAVFSTLLSLFASETEMSYRHGCPPLRTVSL